MSDAKCPYCNVEIEITHDDNYGYEEDTRHEQYCGDCDRNFTYTTSISFYYETFKADCLNGSDHDYKPIATFPKEFTKMECSTCDSRRKPTEEEMKNIMVALPQ